MIKHTYILFCFLLTCTICFGQSGSNPFDLTPRVKKMEAQAAKEKAANQPFVPANPFDIKRAIPANSSLSEETNLQEVIDETIYINPEVKEEEFKRFVFIALLSILIFLTVIFTLFRHSFIKAWKSFLNENMLNQIHREQGFVANVPYLLMNFLFFINAALLVVLIMNYYEYSLFSSNWLSLLFLFGAISGIFLIKHLFLKIAGAVFPFSKETKSYAFTITIFCAILGLILTPLNLCIAYLPKDFTVVIIWISLAIIALTYVFRSIRGFFIGSGYLASNQFHFLLYICAVEIAPTLILLRFIFNQA